MSIPKRLIVVSNRLPVTVDKTASSYELAPSSGGLVTALSPIVRETGGCWIGWTGTDFDPEVERQIRETVLQEGCKLVPVFLTEQERRNFYCGFANEVIWPLFHDLQSRCNFEPVYWESYCEVNEKYADSLVAIARKGDFVWVHDYHLMMLADCLNDRSIRARLAYFHHIPFPPPDIFEKLPWRTDILRALLKFSIVGFQTARDQRNFMHCLRRFLPYTRVRRIGNGVLVRSHDHGTMLGTFPIGIDFNEFAHAAESRQIAERAAEIKQTFSGTMILGVDRLDYTKGIPERLKAFRLLLETRSELRGRATLMQIVVPSREDIPRYRELTRDIEHLVSGINGQFGGPGWVPVHFLHRQVPRCELLAYYRAADIALVTPLKDGMNLVAKEYCAAQVEERGVLILSEFAGAAAQLRAGALIVNPYDSDGLADAIARGCAMSSEERVARMRNMRQIVRTQDVFRWCQSFYRAANFKTEDTAVEFWLPKSPQVTTLTSPIAAWRHAAGAF